MPIWEKAKDDSEFTPDKQAARWFLRVRQGTLSETEKATFDAWRANKANAVAFSKTSRLWSAIDEVTMVPEIVREREKILARLNRRRILGTALIAASVTIAVIVAFALSRRADSVLTEIRTALLSTRTPSQQSFATTVGQRSSANLSDGSVLILNTDSAATVAFNDLERKIVLTRGQAMFEVAKNQSRPFVVSAGGRRIVATGTEFDVRLDRAAVEVTLIEGHVVVDEAGGAVARADHAGASLSAGQRLVAKAGAPVSVSSANLEQITSWTMGKLIFSGARLADAVAESNRYTHTPISLADSALFDLRINGVFRAGQPAEFARAVAQIYPVTVDYLSDGQIRISAKSK